MSTNTDSSLTHTTRTVETVAMEEITTRLLLENSSGTPKIRGVQSDAVDAAKT
jgi:hypothetical protein